MDVLNKNQNVLRNTKFSTDAAVVAQPFENAKI